jgi:very-short-patch-repair endonuclease
VLARASGHHGAGALAAALRDDPGLTRSDAERRLVALLAAAQLPTPRTNARIGRWEADFVWAEQRLVVEFDGWGSHRTRRAFERDRRKDADLLLAGFRVLRITSRELEHRPHAVVARVAIALADRGAGDPDPASPSPR